MKNMTIHDLKRIIKVLTKSILNNKIRHIFINEHYSNSHQLQTLPLEGHLK